MGWARGGGETSIVPPPHVDRVFALFLLRMANPIPRVLITEIPRIREGAPTSASSSLKQYLTQHHFLSLSNHIKRERSNAFGGLCLPSEHYILVVMVNILHSHCF